MGTVKYIEGSRFAHDQKEIQRKIEDLALFLGALTEERAIVARQVHAVIIENLDSDRSVIVQLRESYKDAYDEAQLCFSALHEMEVGFKWKIRVDRILLQS